MKIVAALGSPRQESASSTIVRQILCGACDKADFLTEIYDISKMKINGCMACGNCRRSGINCVQNDDLAAYWKSLQEADVLIVSSPNYHATVCGPMVTFMNRHYCLRDANRNLRLASGKKLIGVFSQGNTDVHGYASAYEWYLSRFIAYGMELLATLIHIEGMSLTNDSPLMRQAYEIGNKLAQIK